jgi:ferredoxin-NADP reductase
MSLWDEEDQQLERDAQPTVGLPLASPANMLPVQVVDREEIAPGVVSVLIVLPGTKQAPAPYLPGQFVTLALPTPRDTLYRSYSLCGGGDPEQPWELTIKRMESGAVSSYFYRSVQEGTLLYASLPRGTFTLPPLLQPDMVCMFVAAGSGITPIMGMLRALTRLPEGQQPLAQLHYASKSPKEVIFGDELDDMDPQETWLLQQHYLSSRQERMSVDAILARAGTMGKRAHWYVCGPDVLKHELQEKLARLGVPAGRIHSEVFATQTGPAYRLKAGTKAGGNVHVAETGQDLEVQPQETLLAALERHGYRPDFSCRIGACGACKLRVLEGEVEPAGEVLSNSERAQGYILGCIGQPIGDVTIASGGRPPAGVKRIAAAAALAGGLGGSARGGGVTRVRVATLVSAGMVLFGSWNMTDHRPFSWGPVVAAAQVQTAQQSATGANSTATLLPGTPTVTVGHGGAASPTAGSGGGAGGAAPTPTIGHGSGGGGAPAPTATTSAGSGGGGGGAPAPTATPAPKPTATPAPKPTPTCVSTPSKPC